MVGGFGFIRGMVKNFGYLSLYGSSGFFKLIIKMVCGIIKFCLRCDWFMENIRIIIVIF